MNTARALLFYNTVLLDSAEGEEGAEMKGKVDSKRVKSQRLSEMECLPERRCHSIQVWRLR